MATDRLELVRLRKESCGCRGPCDDCMLFSLLAAEVHELRANVTCSACEHRQRMQRQDPEGWRDMEMGETTCEEHGEGLLIHSTGAGREVEWSGYGLGTFGGDRPLRAAIDDAMSARSGEGE